MPDGFRTKISCTTRSFTGLPTGRAGPVRLASVDLLAALAPTLESCPRTVGKSVRPARQYCPTSSTRPLPTGRSTRANTRSTASSTPSPQQRSAAGRTRATRAPDLHRVPYRSRWETLTEGQQAVNRSQAEIRALFESAIATLKTWRPLREIRCSTTRVTSLVQAALTLHLTCSH